MKLVIAAACLAVSVSLASHAFADGRTVVTLQQPVAAKTKFVAGGAVWNCEASTLPSLQVYSYSAPGGVGFAEPKIVPPHAVTKGSPFG